MRRSPSDATVHGVPALKNLPYGVLSVLEVWSAWRGGRIPTPEECAEVVIHYAERDAYLPVT